MKKEFFKTAILNILVFLCLILAFNIWFDKELWSSDYSSFVYSVENIFPFLSDDVYIGNTAEFTDAKYATEWITVSTGTKKSTVYFGDGNFGKLSEELAAIRNSIEKEGNETEISVDSYMSAFKGSCIAVKFNNPVDIGKYLNPKESYFSNISPMSDIIIFSAAQDNTSVKYVYFSDKHSTVFYKMPVKYNNGNIQTIISQLTSLGNSDSYAFELNFDKQVPGVDRILFDSYIPITTQTKSIYKTKCRPVTYSAQNSFDSVFKAFNIKKNSARSYKGTDGYFNFIENYSSLKIHESGHFIYEADSFSKGIEIGKTDTATDIMQFANALYRNIADSDGILVLKDTEEVSMHETVYGLIYSDGNTPLYFESVYASTVTVRDGYIVGFELKPMKIEKSRDAFFSGSVIEAYDAVYTSKLSEKKENLIIKSLTPVNFYENGNVINKWYIEFSDGSFEFL